MIIRIVVDDKLVSIDRAVIEMPELDWSKFDGDPSSPWDDIAAVQFDTERGQGHIEYREVMTAQSSRDNMRPPDWKINQGQFEAMFGWVVSVHAARKAEMEAAIAAEAAAVEKARQESIDNPAPETSNAAAAVDTSQLEAAVAAKDAEIAALNAKLASVEAKVDAIVQGVDDAAKGDGA